MNIKKSIYDVLDNHIIQKIRYEYLENPKLNYNNLVKYLKSVFRGSCSSNCRSQYFYVYKGKIYYIHVLINFTNMYQSCFNCDICVSDYTHIYCYKCAPIDSIEYVHFHSRCKN